MKDSAVLRVFSVFSAVKKVRGTPSVHQLTDISPKGELKKRSKAKAVCRKNKGMEEG
jgi:hypothetical protein